MKVPQENFVRAQFLISIVLPVQKLELDRYCTLWLTIFTGQQ